MEKIQFLTPIGCHNEVFATVRLGKKWRTKVQGGARELLMVDGNGDSLGRAEVLDLWFGPMSHLPAIFLEFEHDPICRTWSGLQAVLQSTYKEPIDHTTEVTVLRLRYLGDGAVKLATVKDMPKESFGGRG